MHPFSQPHLFSLTEGPGSQELSSLNVFICSPVSHVSTHTIWPFVSLVIILQPAAVTTRSLSMMCLSVFAPPTPRPRFWLLSSTQGSGPQAAVTLPIFSIELWPSPSLWAVLLSWTMNTENPSRPWSALLFSPCTCSLVGSVLASMFNDHTPGFLKFVSPAQTLLLSSRCLGLTVYSLSP